MLAMTDELKPLGPYFVGMIVDYVGKPGTTKPRYLLSRRRWHVVHTEANQESRVEDALEEMQFGTYVPRVPRKVRFSRERYRTSMKPMLPGYVLTGFDPALDEEWHGISKIRGVLRLFKLNERPVPIPEREMECIRAAEAEERAGKERKPKLMMLKVGNFVQIKDGPFASFFGFVTKVDGRHWKIEVEVDIFSRLVPVEFDCDQVDVILDKEPAGGVNVQGHVKKWPRSPR